MEQGTHKELLKIPRGVYKHMWEVQNTAQLQDNEELSGNSDDDINGSDTLDADDENYLYGVNVATMVHDMSRDNSNASAMTSSMM